MIYLLHSKTASVSNTLALSIYCSAIFAVANHSQKRIEARQSGME